MADNNESIKFIFDLDTKEALEKLLSLKGSVISVGKEENVAGLLEGLTKVGSMAGVLGAAYFALKTTFDAVFEAEQIKAINNQFELLAQNAGISGEALQKGLVKAAGGLVDDTDLLKAANKAIIQMGDSAAKIPELMEVARKSTAAFGGDLLQNFEGMQQAIAAGNTRMLKNQGIIIDVNKATREYAAQLGVAENELSAAGRSQAILNAVLEKGKTAFEGVNENAKENTILWQQIKVDLKEISEAFTLSIEKTFGPIIHKLLTLTKQFADAWKDEVTTAYGVSADAFAARAKQQEEYIEKLKKKLGEFQAMESETVPVGGGFFGKKSDQIASLNKQIDEAEAKLKSMKGESPEGEEGKAKPGFSDSAIDTAKRKENEAKFQKEMIELKKAANKEEMALNDDLENLEKLRLERRALANEEFENKKKEIHNATHLNSVQKQQEIEQLERTHTEQMKSMDFDLYQQKMQTIDNYAKHYSETMDGLSRGFKARMEQDKLQMNNFAKIGASVYDSYKTHAVNAFLAVGAGQKSAAEAVKSIAFNMIADQAQARGEVLLIEGIWPPNPLALGAGAGLVALAGLLRSQAGGGSGGIGGSGGGGGGGSFEGAGVNDLGASGSGGVAEKANPRKEVNINIAGHLFETEQTRTRIVEMVRDASDATDFSFKQIGQA